MGDLVDGWSRRKVLSGVGAVTGGVLLGAGGLELASGTSEPAHAGPVPQPGEVTVSPRPVYCGVWVPSTSGQYLRLDRNYDQLIAEYGQMWNLGYRMKTLTTYTASGGLYYSAAYNPSTAGQGLRIGRDQNGLLTEYGQMWDQNFRLATLSACVINGQLLYDAVYNPSTSGQYLRLHRTYDEFLAVYGEMWNLNFRLTQMVSYVQNGQVYFGGFFHPSTAGQYLRLWRTAGDFLTEYGQMWNQNFRLAALSTHVVNGDVYYNAAYNPSTAGNFVGLDRPADPLLTTYGDMWGQNFRLAILATEKVEGLSPTRLAQRIRDRISTNVTGFAASVATGALRASSTAGLRRTSADSPSRSWSSTSRINIASINKTITAVAVMQRLAANGLTLDSTVSGYLPSDWTLGANVNTITFRELLTHTSGIREGSNGTGYTGMKNIIAGGISLANKTFLYQNSNFALFRVIIPYLNGFNEAGVTDKDTATSNAYLAYINQRIFAPIGISTVTAKPATTEPSLCYPFPAGTAKGDAWGDWTKTCGGGGLNMSAHDLGTFLLRLRESSTLLNSTQVAQMTENLLGWQGRDPVRHGFVNNHGGFLFRPPTSTRGQIELNTLVCSFSSGVHVGLTVNSPVGGGVGLWQAVVDSYHDAWLTL
ncbi:MAG TPA: serine hydrolase [Candidatus Limnocylindrales bacterium]